MTDQFPDATKMVLSPAAQAVWDAFSTAPICSEVKLATTLRAVANEIVPETPPLFEPWATAVDLELLRKDERRRESIRVHQCLMSIADELEEIKYDTYRSPLPEYQSKTN